MLRAPLRFGLVILALGLLDGAVVQLASGYGIRMIWIDRLGTLALPLLWTLPAATRDSPRIEFPG